MDWITIGSTIYSDISLSTDELAQQEIQLSAFPNPCNDLLRINFFNQSREYDLMITNAMGQVLVSKVVSPLSNDIIIPMSNYTPGMYFIHIRDNNRYKTVKVMKL